MQENQGLDEVRAMKARGVEHVRYRFVKVPTDVVTRAVVARMCNAALECRYERARSG